MQTRIKRQNQANTRGDICMYKENAIECIYVTLIGRSDVQDGVLVARQGVRKISKKKPLSLFQYLRVCYPFLILAKSIINQTYLLKIVAFFLFVYFFNQDSFP